MKIYSIFIKRGLDLIISFSGIILALPFFFVLAILIKMDSKGPVFFVQKRLGLKGRVFFLIKFRTMYFNIEKGKTSFEPGKSVRITMIGRFLRRTKLDELPQLFNVLKGEMSLVGPRPEVPQYREFYSGKYRKILDVRPGITDRASIKYVQEEKLLSRECDAEKFYEEVLLPDKLNISLIYAEEKISFAEDMKIILNTVASILHKNVKYTNG